MSSINLQADRAFENFLVEARGAMQDVAKMVIIMCGERLVYRSPVGDPSSWKRQPPYLPKGYTPGQFKNNWQLGVDNIPQGIIAKSDPSGQGSYRRIRMAIPRWPIGHKYYFVNNLPYASELENGHSRQCPPGGMVSLVELEFENIVRICEQRYKSGERPGRKADL